MIEAHFGVIISSVLLEVKSLSQAVAWLLQGSNGF